jgi:CHAT domain-containing protein
MNLREHAPFLAYLSACGTGEIRDERFFDESIHLISACQIAGFRHVIGTLWAVNDRICEDIAEITYKEMIHGGMVDESVCLGLHKATRKLRDRWLRDSKEVRYGNALAGKSESDIAKEKADDKNGRDSRLPRKVNPCDSDEENDEPLHWVPYVHFGV